MALPIDDPKQVWLVKPHPEGVNYEIGARKRRFTALPALRSQRLSDEIGDDIARRFFPEFTGCTTGEMASRPTPQGFINPTTQMKAMSDLFDEWIPHLLPAIGARLRLKPQAFDVRGGIGYPVWKTTPRKIQTCRPYWDLLLKGDLTFLRGSVTTANVRLQPERRSKIRDVTFINRHGEPYAAKITRERRESADGWLFMRSRPVMRCNVSNTATQFVDSMIHDTFLASPTAHFTGLYGYKVPYEFRFFADVAHFERSLGHVMVKWANAVGGMYGELVRIMYYSPYVVPSEDWSGYYSMTLRPGATAQLGSGVSPVTDLAKAFFWIIYAQARREMVPCTHREAIDWVYAGTGSPFFVMNYGDDNVIAAAKKGDLDRVVSIVGRYITLEEEVPPAFLGHNYDEARGFVMRARSYWANFWLAERPPATIFRPYPYFGFVKRREIYSAQGEDAIVRSIIPLENKLLREAGLPIEFIEREARREAAMIAAEPDNILLGREHVMTLDEKARSEYFQILPVEQVAKYTDALLKDSALYDHFRNASK